MDGMNQNLGPQWWHGTPDDRQTGTAGPYGVHVGSREAAKQALEARIGRRADGRDWDGSQEYGKTLLSRDQTRHEFDPQTRKFTTVVEHQPPEFPSGRASYSDGSPVPMDARPSLFPVRITGPMSNSPQAPHEDFRANGYMRGQLKRGTARRGYFYTNVSEDEGSISAVVPNWQHLERER